MAINPLCVPSCVPWYSTSNVLLCHEEMVAGSGVTNEKSLLVNTT